MRRRLLRDSQLTHGLAQVRRHQRTEGWMAAVLNWAEESPDSMKQRCRVTPGQGNLRDSATEKKPLLFRLK